MKKKTIILIIALIAYCFLFYKQMAGINVIIFNTLLISCLLITDKTLVKSKVWLATAAGALISATGALLYGSLLSCIGNVFALLLLAHLSVDKNASLVFALLQSVWNYIATFFLLIIEMAEPKPEREEETENAFTIGNFLKYTIPVAVLFIFFLIYKNSNPVFGKFVNELHIDISWNFIGFLTSGLFLLYVFFFSRKFNTLTDIDQRKGNVLSGGINEAERGIFSNLNKELSAAVLTFGLLNVLLLLVNILDIRFILSGAEASVAEHSRYVHQGINSSIFSVLIAILVTLYFFRGNLNFIAENKVVKMLALGWIVLNAVLLLTCFHKNFTYIAECGLTHKRIGVYFYLFLTFIGLITTWIKIMKLKSNMFMLRMNMWPLFAALVFSSLFNWNKIILDHNTEYQAEVIDREYYLFKLSETSLPFLLENWESLPGGYYYDKPFQHMLNYQKHLFLLKYKKAGWQSWNFEDERIYQLIQQTSTRAK